MIKFFRNFRKNLFIENKTSKPTLPAGRYFKYAIGEIILVVIGILIALQINNWNENQKSKKDERYILTEVLKNLEEDAVLERWMKTLPFASEAIKRSCPATIVR